MPERVARAAERSALGQARPSGADRMIQPMNDLDQSTAGTVFVPIHLDIVARDASLVVHGTPVLDAGRFVLATGDG